MLTHHRTSDSTWRVTGVAGEVFFAVHPKALADSVSEFKRGLAFYPEHLWYSIPKEFSVGRPRPADLITLTIGGIKYKPLITKEQYDALVSANEQSASAKEVQP